MHLAPAFLLALAVAVGMEAVAWATHKYVMQGFLWVLHEHHHQAFGRNEARSFGFLYAPPRFNVRKA